MSDKSNWLQNTPKDVRLSIFLIFKIGLLIFHHNHVELSDYSEVFQDLDSVQNWLYVAEMVIHLFVMGFVNLFLIIAIAVNVFAIRRTLRSNIISNKSSNNESSRQNKN